MERGTLVEPPKGTGVSGVEISNCRVAATVSTAAATASGSAPVSRKAASAARAARSTCESAS